MAEDVIVTALIVITVVAGIWAWWIDNHGTDVSKKKEEEK